jgi:hypothetical protein
MHHHQPGQALATNPAHAHGRSPRVATVASARARQSPRPSHQPHLAATPKYSYHSRTWRARHGLLRELGREVYGDALARHNHLLRAVFAERGGVEVDRQGRGIVAVSSRSRSVPASPSERTSRSERPRSRRRQHASCMWTCGGAVVDAVSAWEPRVSRKSRQIRTGYMDCRNSDRTRPSSVRHVRSV